MKAKSKSKNNKLDFKPGKILMEFDVKGAKGEKVHVILRYPKMSDVDDALRFVNKSALESEFLRFNKKMTRKEEAKYIRDVIKKTREGKALYIIAIINGELAGSGGVEKGQHADSHLGDLGLMIAEKYTNIGIGKHFMDLLMNESLKIGVEVVKLSVFEKNARAKHVYERLGFNHVGIIPKARKNRDGTYQGESIMYKILV